QFQLVGLDQPAVVARLAGGEGAVLDSVLAFTQEFDRLGLPARRKECLTGLRTRRESKIRFLEYSGRIPDRIPQRGPLQGVAVALKAHVPAGFDVFVSFVIGQGVGPDRQVPSTQARVTLCARVLTGDTFDAIRVEDDWQGVRLGALLRRTPRLKSLPLCSHRDRTGQRKGQRRTAGKYARHIGEAWTWAFERVLKSHKSAAKAILCFRRIFGPRNAVAPMAGGNPWKGRFQHNARLRRRELSALLSDSTRRIRALAHRDGRAAGQGELRALRACSASPCRGRSARAQNSCAGS